jgi:hypothetical protein
MQFQSTRFQSTRLASISPLTKKYTDYSDLEKFVFGFFCDNCGWEWKSPPVMFTSGGFSSIENEEIKNLIRAREHQVAFETANLEAHFHFNYCAEKALWECDDCFCLHE